MKDILLNGLKFGLVFFLLGFGLHFIFPEEVDMLTCFILFLATGAAEILLGFVRMKTSEKKEK